MRLPSSHPRRKIVVGTGPSSSVAARRTRRRSGRRSGRAQGDVTTCRPLTEAEMRKFIGSPSSSADEKSGSSSEDEPYVLQGRNIGIRETRVLYFDNGQRTSEVILKLSPYGTCEEFVDMLKAKCQSNHLIVTYTAFRDGPQYVLDISDQEWPIFCPYEIRARKFG